MNDYDWPPITAATLLAALTATTNTDATAALTRGLTEGDA